jgi:hypothetical protein
MSARIVRVLAVAAALVAPAAAAQAVQAGAAAATPLPDSLSGATAVTYVSGQSVYISAGSRDGLWHGSRVVVLRSGAVIAELKVHYLSSHSAACDVATASTAVNIYDSVRYSKLPADSVKVAQARASGAPPPSRLKDLGIRGRIGVTYQLVAGRDSATGKISQPGLELSLFGAAVGGSPIFFALDTRSRRTYTVLPDGTTTSDDALRVYQAAVTWVDAGSGAHVTMGRQYVSALSSVSLFDGATAEIVKQHWSFGAFGGSQPDPLTMGYSSRIRQYGGYVQVHQAPISPLSANGGGAQWAFTVGGIGSYDAGALNREFLFAQAFFSSRRFTLYATQEVDYNRGWKAAMGLPTLAPTSTFATAQLQVTDFVSLYGGFDNRRNVILYRDFVSPETSFDDRFREGVWGGISIAPMHALHIGGDARQSLGGPYGPASSYTGWIATNFAMQGTLRLRTTKYTSTTMDGWLYAGNVGFSPVWRLRLELNGGLRQEHDPRLVPTDSTTVPQNMVRWFGLDADVGLSRSWYLLISAMRTTGGLESNDQLYASLSYRF